LLGVLSSLVVAFYTIVNERLAQTFQSEVITVYQMIGGSIGLAAIMPFYLHIFPVATLVPSMQDFIYLLMLSLFCTVLLYMLLIRALQKISAFTVNLSFNLEPIYTIALAILIYKENRELTIPFYIGLCLIILSVILQMVKVSMQHKKAQSVVS